MKNINNTMKKIVLTLLLVSASFALNAQEKGFHLTFSGHLGASSLGYMTDTDVRSQFNLGYGGAIGLQYFFTQHFGLGTGVGATFYNCRAPYSHEKDFEGMIDAVNDSYTLKLGLNNWTELQKAFFLEVPLMLLYQTKWGEKEAVGMYFGAGAKLQLPIKSSYNVKKGSELSVTGHFPGPNLNVTIDNLPDLGYGKNTNTGYEGDIDLKFGVAATAEIGFLINLNRRWDITLGAFADYGFLNMKNGNKVEGAHLIAPENGNREVIHPAPNIGDKIQYNGYINSSTVEKVNPIFIGGKLGLRVKLGKLKERHEDVDEEKECPVIIIRDSVRDSVIVRPIIVEVEIPMIQPQQPQQPQTQSQPQPQQFSQEEQEMLKARIFFDLNKADLRTESKLTLDRVIAFMNKYPDIRLRIVGNTCTLGSEKINVPLGFRRAESAKKYMVGKGIDPGRISTSTASSHDPLMTNNEEVNRQLNRRCEFEIETIK